MSNELVIVDTDTRLGALKRETHWSLVLAAVGGGLTFTWIGHMMAWTPALFAVHGLLGVVGGYLVGTGVSRVLTGMRVRLPMVRYEQVTAVNRFVSSALRIGVGALFFAASYFVATGVTISLDTIPLMPELIGAFLPFAIWGLILGVFLIRRIVHLMR